MIERKQLAAALFLTLLLSMPAFAAGPGSSWQMTENPADAGWSPEALAAARAKAESIGSSAVMVVDSGHVIAAWGDVERRFRSASLRKSLVSTLYGIAVDRKQVNLNSTLAELKIDEIDELTAGEKKATLRDLLSARSGVYLPAAKVTPGQVKQRPTRGSHPAGSFWFYNNWDFNVAGGVLARATGVDPGEFFLREIARTTGMEDFRSRDFYWELEPRVSRHPAFDFRISSRDLARLGHLYLNRGMWNGKRILSESWIDESVRIVTPFGDGSGYGYMWWINPERSSQFGIESAEHGEGPMSFAAEGAGAQILFVLPSKNIVIVHRGDTDNGRGVDEREALLLISQILRARTGEANDRVTLTSLRADPLPNAKPAPAELEAIPLERKALEELKGTYVVSSEMSVELFEDSGHLFAAAPGRGELELLPFAADKYFSRSIPLVVEPERGATGEIVAIRAVLQGRPMRGVKRTVPPEDAARDVSAPRSE